MQSDTEQQHNNVPIEPSSPSQSGFNWKRLLLFIFIAIIAVALSGVSVWGYMSNQNDNNSKSLNAQITTKTKTISSLQSNVKTLQTQVAAKTTTTNTQTTSSSSASNGKYEQLLTQCNSNNMKASGPITLIGEADNSSFVGSCDEFSSKVVGVGDLWVYAYTNNSWNKIFETNGAEMSASMCTQYKVPKSLGVGC